MASSSSLSVPLLMKDKEPRNWADLPPELTSSILLRLDVDEILLSAQRVCRSWRRVCKDPSMWQKINIPSIFYNGFDSLCRHVVDLSQGGLLEINISRFVSDDLLSYIAHRSTNLRSLALGLYYPMTNQGFLDAIASLPLLETLEISCAEFKLSLKDIGQACPQLQTFKLNSTGYVHYSGFGHDDEYALEIAENMPELRHLQLFGNRITNNGLKAVLDNLLYLNHLDVRKCFNLNLVENLEKRCLEWIKELKRPDDSTADCPFDIIFYYSWSDEALVNDAYDNASYGYSDDAYDSDDA